MNNLVSQRFGRLVVLAAAPPKPYRSGTTTMWLCQCDCGNTKTIAAQSLARGATQSCGCRWKELSTSGSLGMSHGCAKKGQNTPEYRVWASIHQRVKAKTKRNSCYANITVCERWSNFECFLEDMGPKPSPKHSIDRIDGEKSYAPDNCRWATIAEQNANRCVTVRDEGQTLAEIAVTTGIPLPTIRNRYYRYHLRGNALRALLRSSAVRVAIREAS